MEESSRRHLGALWGGHIYRWTVLPFGLKTAPYIFQKCFKTLDFWINRKLGLKSLRYLDDLIVMGPKDKLKLGVTEILILLESMHVRISEKSGLTPTKSIDFIGYDIKRGVIDIRLKTLEKLTTKLTTLLNSAWFGGLFNIGSRVKMDWMQYYVIMRVQPRVDRFWVEMPLNQYLSVLGGLNFCAKIFSPVVHFSYQDAMRQYQGWRTRVNGKLWVRNLSESGAITSSQSLDVWKWFRIFPQSILTRNMRESARFIQILQTRGWDGAQGELYGSELIPQWLVEKGIFYKELFGVTKAILGAPLMTIVVVFIDNIGVYHCLRKMRGSMEAYKMISRIVRKILQDKIFVVPLWVSTHENPVDRPSRHNFKAACTINHLWAKILDVPFSIMYSRTRID